jgi:hypothetical protein
MGTVLLVPIFIMAHVPLRQIATTRQDSKFVGDPDITFVGDQGIITFVGDQDIRGSQTLNRT